MDAYVHHAARSASERRRFFRLRIYELGSLLPVSAVQSPSTCLDLDRLATIKPMSSEAPQLLERYVAREGHALVPKSHIEDGFRRR
jgi:hypothetical protein